MKIKELKEVLSNMDDEYKIVFYLSREEEVRRRMLMKIKELKEVLNNLNTYIKENANEY